MGNFLTYSDIILITIDSKKMPTSKYRHLHSTPMSHREMININHCQETNIFRSDIIYIISLRVKIFLLSQ